MKRRTCAGNSYEARAPEVPESKKLDRKFSRLSKRIPSCFATIFENFFGADAERIPPPLFTPSPRPNVPAIFPQNAAEEKCDAVTKVAVPYVHY
jgi:hypothetical protein